MIADNFCGFVCFGVLRLNRIDKHAKGVFSVGMGFDAGEHLVFQEHAKMLAPRQIVVTSVKLLADNRLFDDAAMKAEPATMKERLNQVIVKPCVSRFYVAPFDFRVE